MSAFPVRAALPAGTTDVVLRELFPVQAPSLEPGEFLADHVEIEEPDGTVIPFELWDCQRDTLTALHEDGAIIVLKARRLGLSWVVLAYALWLAIFQQGIRILILCKVEDDSKELLDRIRRMRDRIAATPGSEHLLAGLQRPARVRDAVTTLDVGASTIRALVGTESAARSETAGLVILDEFAFQRGAGGIWRAVIPTVEGGGKLAVVSTGNGDEHGAGLGAEFAKQWGRAIQGTSPLQPLFFPWSARPGRDEEWKRRTIEQLGDEERFRTEYPEEPADAFVQPDVDLVYDGSHLAACKRLGTELDRLPAGKRPEGPVWLGIDWGVNTHALLARRLPGGGLYVFAEIVNSRGDLEQFTDDLVAALKRLDLRVTFERFDAAEPVIHDQFRKLFRRRAGYSPRWLKIPFGKHKQPAIKYAKLLMRRTYAGKQLRRLGISPAACPVLLRQAAILQWRDADDGRVEKGDDHGPDALVTLTAELAAEFYARKPAGETDTPVSRGPADAARARVAADKTQPRR